MRSAAVGVISATTPTFSWPWTIGNGVSVSAGVPAYCFVSPA